QLIYRSTAPAVNRFFSFFSAGVALQQLNQFTRLETGVNKFVTIVSPLPISSRKERNNENTGTKIHRKTFLKKSHFFRTTIWSPSSKRFLAVERTRTATIREAAMGASPFLQ